MAGDGALIFEGIQESFNQFKKWLPWAQEMPTVNACEETARNFYTDFISKKAMHFIIFLGNECVGMCSYNLINWNLGSADIGYWCRVSQQGKGLITEAVHALVEYACNQLNFSRLTITCHIDNIASQRVASKAGFLLEKEGFGLISGVEGKSTLARRYIYLKC